MSYLTDKHMITDEEVRTILSMRAAHRQRSIDEQKLYDTVKAQSLADGMVEVEPGHFVRPGEPYRDDAGVWHENRA